MVSHRFRRRSFLTAVSGGVGLKIMLRNLEGAAQGMRSPARLLVTHWPTGIVAGANDALWKPTSGSVGGSPGLKPFADAGLGPDMTVMRGLSIAHLASTANGNPESNTVALVTGLAPAGTRSGEQEGDDAFAAGPSFDQLLLKNVPALQRPGVGFANAIADSRTDFGEISTKCLSYANTFQAVGSVSGATQEAVPLMGVLSPLVQYTNLFGSFVPGTGGGTPPQVADGMLKNLVGKRSVLDFALDELTEVNRLAPSDARSKLAVHTDAVVAAEASVARAINARYPDPGCSGGCTTKPAAPPAVMGTADRTGGVGNSFGTPTAGATDDAPVHQQTGAAHLDVLKAAFICDLIRVGTFQWSPGTNHVGFTLFPNDTRAYQHHPQSHKITTIDTTRSAKLEELNTTAIFLFNVQTWYFARMAENLAGWKRAVDGCGNNLLDFTCVPFLTESMAVAHERENIPAMLIGGRQLGFRHDRYVTDKITINQLWGTIAQAYTAASKQPPFAPPVAGFWAKP